MFIQANAAFAQANSSSNVGISAAFTQANAAFLQANSSYNKANTAVTTGKSIAMAIVFGG